MPSPCGFRINFCRDGKEWPLTKTHSLGNYIGYLLVISHSFSYGKCRIYQRFSYYQLFYFFHGRLWHDCRRPTRMPRWQHCNAEPENSWLSSFWDCEFAQHYTTHNYDLSKTIFTGAFHTLWNVNYMYIMYNTFGNSTMPWNMAQLYINGLPMEYCFHSCVRLTKSMSLIIQYAFKIIQADLDHLTSMYVIKNLLKPPCEQIMITCIHVYIRNGLDMQ